MKGTIIFCAFLAAALAKPNGHYQQQYQYQSSSSSYKNNELEHQKNQEGYYAQHGDLEGRVKPKVDSYAQEMEYTNPKFQQGTAAQNQNLQNGDFYLQQTRGSDSSANANRLNNYQNAATSNGAVSSWSSSSGYSGSMSFGTGSTDGGVQAPLATLSQKLQEDLSRRLQNAISEQGQHRYSSSSSTYGTNYQTLEQEMKNNLTRLLQHEVNQHNNGQSQNYGGLSNRPSQTGGSYYNSQDVELLRRQLEDSLTRQLQNTMQQSHQSTYSSSASTSNTQHADTRPIHLTPDSYQRPLPSGYTQVRQVSIPARIQLPDISHEVESNLLRTIDQAVTDTFTTRSGNSYNIRLNVDYQTELDNLMEELRRNLTQQFNNQLIQNYGNQERRGSYYYTVSSNSAQTQPNYRVDELESAKLNLQNRLTQQLQQKFTQQYNLHESYTQRTPINPLPLANTGSHGQIRTSNGQHNTNRIYTQVPSVQTGQQHTTNTYVISANAPIELQHISRDVQTDLSRQLQQALEEQKRRYFSSSNDYQNQQTNDLIMQQLREELKRNLTDQLKQSLNHRYGTQEQRNSYYYSLSSNGRYSTSPNYNSQQLDQLTQQLENNLLQQLQQGLRQQRSYSYSSSANYQGGNTGAAYTSGSYPTYNQMYGGEDCDNMQGDDASAGYNYGESVQNELTDFNGKRHARSAGHGIPGPYNFHHKLAFDSDHIPPSFHVGHDTGFNVGNSHVHAEDLSQQTDSGYGKLHVGQGSHQQTGGYGNLHLENLDHQHDLTQQPDSGYGKFQFGHDHHQHAGGYGNHHLGHFGHPHDFTHHPGPAHDSFHMGHDHPHPGGYGSHHFGYENPQFGHDHPHHFGSHHSFGAHGQQQPDLPQSHYHNLHVGQIEHHDTLGHANFGIGPYGHNHGLSKPPHSGYGTFNSGHYNRKPFGSDGYETSTHSGSDLTQQTQQDYDKLKIGSQTQHTEDLQSSITIGQGADLTQQIEKMKLQLTTSTEKPETTDSKLTIGVPEQGIHPVTLDQEHGFLTHQQDDMTRTDEAQIHDVMIHSINLHGMLEPLTHQEMGHQHDKIQTNNFNQNQEELTQQTEDTNGKLHVGSFGQQQIDLTQQSDESLTQQTEDMMGPLHVGSQGQHQIDLTPQDQDITQQTDDFMSQLQVGNHGQHQIDLTSTDDTQQTEDLMGQLNVGSYGQQQIDLTPQHDTQQTEDLMGQLHVGSHGQQQIDLTSHDNTQQTEDLMGQLNVGSHGQQQIDLTSHDDTQQTEDLMGQLNVGSHGQQQIDLTPQDQDVTQQTDDFMGQLQIGSHGQQQLDLTQQQKDLTQQIEDLMGQLQMGNLEELELSQQKPQTGDINSQLQVGNTGQHQIDLTQQQEGLTQQTDDFMGQLQIGSHGQLQIDLTQQQEGLTQQTDDFMGQLQIGSHGQPQIDLTQQQEGLTQQTDDFMGQLQIGSHGQHQTDLTQQQEGLTQQTEDDDMGTIHVGGVGQEAMNFDGQQEMDFTQQTLNNEGNIMFGSHTDVGNFDQEPFNLNMDPLALDTPKNKKQETGNSHSTSEVGGYGQHEMRLTEQQLALIYGNKQNSNGKLNGENHEQKQENVNNLGQVDLEVMTPKIDFEHQQITQREKALTKELADLKIKLKELNKLLLNNQQEQDDLDLKIKEEALRNKINNQQQIISTEQTEGASGTLTFGNNYNNNDQQTNMQGNLDFGVEQMQENTNSGSSFKPFHSTLNQEPSQTYISNQGNSNLNVQEIERQNTLLLDSLTNYAQQQKIEKQDAYLTGRGYSGQRPTYHAGYSANIAPQQVAIEAHLGVTEQSEIVEHVTVTDAPVSTTTKAGFWSKVGGKIKDGYETVKDKAENVYDKISSSVG